MQRMGANETQTKAEAEARAGAELFLVSSYCQCFVLDARIALNFQIDSNNDVRIL